MFENDLPSPPRPALGFLHLTGMKKLGLAELFGNCFRLVFEHLD